MPNNPHWRRWHGLHHRYIEPLGEVSEHGLPTVGVGGFRCNDCGKPHVTIACVGPDGREMNLQIDPQTAMNVIQALVEILSDAADVFVALQAMRALGLVRELATMTDTEADFLNGSGLQSTCLSILNGETATLPRLYNEQDRDRAVAVMLGFVSESTGDVKFLSGEIVDSIASALGLTRAGA